ncbi:hypothetical protein ACFQY0_19495 [Haloferula chungangensis]|uniref:Sulfotransferase n=1 Tax=Haloferula chungangensis TaxID=1048331 RepID=A0ABW2LD13_9BACT
MTLDVSSINVIKMINDSSPTTMDANLRIDTGSMGGETEESRSSLCLHWVIGGEGTGHHALRHAFDRYLKRPDVLDKGPHYPLWVRMWDAHLPRLPRKAIQGAFRSLVAQYCASGVRAIFEDTSFPYGGVGNVWSRFASPKSRRGPLRRPDIAEMLRLLEGLPMKILVLHRSPILTVNSTLSRGFSSDLQFEAELAETTHQYIAEQVGSLPESSYRTLAFERLVEDPLTCLKALAQWWEIDETHAAEGAEKIRKPTSLNEVSEDRLRFLEQYFSEEKRLRWDSVYQNNSLVS